MNPSRRAISNADASEAPTSAQYYPTSETSPPPKLRKLIRGDAATAAIKHPESPRLDLKTRAETVSIVAAKFADSVDRDARFPNEAFDEARAHRLLGVMVPKELGGEGASVSDVIDVGYILARGCASTAMIYAMHQIMVAILARHAADSPWHNRFMRRIAKEELLLASSTTDGTGGGDLRKSACAVERVGAKISLTKNATVMSYGANADAVLTTARRTPDAAASDQVLVALMKADYRLDPTTSWDTLGMRGTCSAGFKLTGAGESYQVLADPYEKIQAHTMMPVAHLAWSAVWAGIAAAAVERARRFVRSSARRGESTPPGAAHLTRAAMSLRGLREIVAGAAQKVEKAGSRDAELESLEFQTAMNLLKVNASESATSTVMNAMQACGLSGYRNDGEFSLSRHLRDVLSAPIMINNERILASVATASLLLEAPHSLRNAEHAD